MSTPEERRFYTGKAWRSLRQTALANAGGLCVKCKRYGRIRAATEIDHIIPVKERPDLRLVLSNCQALCHDCHSIKTASDRRPTPRFCLHGQVADQCNRCKAENQ